MSLLKVKNLKKIYRTPRAFARAQETLALRDVSFDIHLGECLAVVGESGCGKTTLAKILLRIEDFDAGEIQLSGRDLRGWSKGELSSHVQMIFQDPHSALNPRKTLRQIIAEPLVIKGLSHQEQMRRVDEIAHHVGLRPDWLQRYPHMLSGGQKQRVGIARALVTRPQLVICDEPVSALDVSVQAQVLNLLLDLQKEFHLSYLFISHDLGVVRFIADRVAVLQFGEIVESGPARTLFQNPQHEYTRQLLRATPQLDLSSTDEVAQ